MEETIAQLIGGLKSGGIHMDVLAQFTITEDGPAKNADFYINIQECEMSEALVRLRKAQKLAEFKPKNDCRR
jgi:hypothetical protein